MILDNTGKPYILNKNEHFATLERSGDYLSMLDVLPDPDEVLKRQGRDISIYKKLLVDDHLESNITVRLASVSGSKWQITPGGESSSDKKAYELCDKVFKKLNIHKLIKEMMEAVLYGFKPIEIIWSTDGNYWLPSEIIGKPSEWFAFDKYSKLVFKGKNFYTEPVPDLKFIVPVHRGSYENPYGVRLLSKCFWPVTIKRNGYLWWTTFMEKYGSAFLTGKYPSGANQIYKDELLNSLHQMVDDAVAIYEEGTAINIQESIMKQASSDAYDKFVNRLENSISKVILGQTLTTQTDSKNSYAIGRVHNEVRSDIVNDDKQMIEEYMNEILSLITNINLNDASTPFFAFENSKDYEGKTKIFKSIYDVGYKLTPKYISQELDIPETEIIPFTVNNNGFKKMENKGIKPDNNSFACHDFKSIKSNTGVMTGITSFFTRLFGVNKEEKQIVKDYKIINEFAKTKEKDFQNIVNTYLEDIMKIVKTSKNFDELYDKLANDRPDLDTNQIVDIITNIRYVASQVGAFSETDSADKSNKVDSSTKKKTLKSSQMI